MEESRATRREETGSLNHCMEQSCPLIEVCILDFTGEKNKLVLDVFCVCVFAGFLQTEGRKQMRKDNKGTPVRFLSSLGERELLFPGSPSKPQPGGKLFATGGQSESRTPPLLGQDSGRHR